MALLISDNRYYITRAAYVVLVSQSPDTPFAWSSGTSVARFSEGVIGSAAFDTAVEFTQPFVEEPGTPATLPIDADPPFPPVWPYTWNPSLLWGRENLTQNLRCIRGNTLKFQFHITQNGENLDITGCELTLTAKWNVTDSAAVFQCSLGSGLTITDAPTGYVEATISSTQTSTGIPLHQIPLYYDVEMILDGEVSTVLYGVLTISPNVTNI